MKILLSAFSCNPYHESDAYVGWAYAMAISKYHDVYVLTRLENKKDIEHYIKNSTEKISNIHFYYIEQSKFFINFLYRINRYLGFLGSYFNWQKRSYKFAKRLNEKIKFDVCHHVSIADFRCAGYLWKLNIPFIFGPVGGGQETPKVLKEYTKGHKFGEFFRFVMNRLTISLPSYHKALSKAYVIFCSNDETAQLLKRRIKKNANKILYLTELCIDDNYIEKRKIINRKNNEIVHVLTSSRLIYRKGLFILLEAVTKISAESRFIIDIYGDGNQREKLEEFVKKNNISDKVVFHGKIPFNDMQQAYIDCDIYVLTSIRETTGTAVIEAMANKLPVITLNQNGAKKIVGNDSGILINLNNKEQIIADLAYWLSYLIDNYGERCKLGENGYNKIISNYTWNNRAIFMSDVYKKACLKEKI